MKKSDYLEELKEMAGEFDDEPKSNGADSEENSAAEEKPEPLDMEDSIECEVTVRTKDMRSFLFSHNYSSFSGWFGVIISLIALVCIALLAGYIRNQRLQKKIERGELDAMPEVKEADAECCGQHEICERDSLLAAVSKKIEYYDDEELDQFIGKAGDAYTEEETEMFRDVLYTTLDVEVAGWVRSLQLRGIELPDDLKDEVFLIIGERRNIEVKKADDR